MNRLIALLFLALPAALLLTACTDTLDVTGCAGDDCLPCEGDGDCDGALYCGEDGYCAPHACTPGESTCEGDSVVRCNARGSGFHEPQACPGGTCSGGSCGCVNASDCATGESCDAGVCTCPTGPSCGPQGICCPDGEACQPLSVCDGPDDCEEVFLCQPACGGEFCGISGDICCEGSTPVCGPTGQCATDCGGAELCGPDYDQCCAAGDICVFGECRTPGAPCDTFIDCDWGEYCDQALGQCMPDDFPQDIQCRLDGDFLELEITEKWSWEENDIISIPVVGDVTGDGQPNVVVNASRANEGEPGYDPNNDFFVGQIVILDSSGNTLHRIPHNPAANTWGSQGRSNIALGDVTGDGVLDIIYASLPIDGTEFGLGRSHIIAVNGQGQTIWRAENANGTALATTVYNGGITVANFDGSGRAQVVVGATLIDSDGTVVWQDGDGATEGSNDGYTGGIALVADLTGDGNHEIVTGRRAWTVSWSGSNVSVSQLWAHDGPDGYPAIADMTGNGKPDVVLVAARTVRILEGDTGRLVCGRDPSGQACAGNDSLRTQPIFLPGPTTQNRGGPPTVADFDGDGRPEIGVAGGHYYTVFDFHRPSFGADNAPEQIDQALLTQFGQPQPANGELYVRWFFETQDLSSNTTGSSVFDFQGDGRASVVYADECFLRVFNGTDGAIELEIMNSTGTILEYPLVVDVDANGRSEILVVANDIDYGCSNLVPDFQFRKGLFVYEDPNDRWVRTRSIWNQHAYSIDNILDDGSLPTTQQSSWATHNTFRANRQGEIPLNAADVAITAVQANPNACPTNMDFQITVQNQGSASIPAGLPVSVYITAPSTEYLGTVTVPSPIPPGASATANFSYPVQSILFNLDLYFLFRANDGGDETEVIFDCNPDSAVAETGPLVCRYTL